MTTKQEYLDSLVNDFLESIDKKRRAKVTHDGYRWLILKINRQLMAAGLEANPRKWTEHTILFIRDVAFAHLRLPVARREMSVLNSYAQFHGNTVIKDMELEWPRDDRIHVDWLTPEQANQVMEAAEGIERIVVHLELNIGLRRVEVLRLKVTDIELGFMQILGKGRQGGKPRTNPFHPDTVAELNLYHLIREAEVAKAKAKNPGVQVPSSLLIYEWRGELHPYKRSALDKMLARVSKRAGVKFTNHTLRRTYGRTLWLASVPIETIAELMGHEDTRTTILYLGLNMDDKASAMKKLADFQHAVKHRENEKASSWSGQSGI